MAMVAMVMVTRMAFLALAAEEAVNTAAALRPPPRLLPRRSPSWTSIAIMTYHYCAYYEYRTCQLCPTQLTTSLLSPQPNSSVLN
jgi:hypothetical protein